MEASTDVDNAAEQRAGFVRKTTARGAQFRGGEYRDMVTFSRLRTDG